MKRILLTTTSLVLAAGVAQAEVTFSGKAEAGVSRTSKVDAVAAVAGVKVTESAAVSASSNGATSHTADDGTVTIGYVNGVLTTTAMTKPGSPDAITANSADVTAAPTSGSLRAFEVAVIQAREAVVDAEAALGTATEQDHLDEEIDAVAVAKAKLAQAEAVYAAMKGAAIVPAVKEGDMVAYSGYDMEVAVSSTLDNGMVVSAGFDMGAGSIADRDDDRVLDAQAGAIALSAVTIKNGGVTYVIGNDEIDDLYDDTQNGDVSVSGAMGGISYTLVADLDKDTAAVAASTLWTEATGSTADDTLVVTAAKDPVYESTSLKLSGAAAGVDWTFTTTNKNDRGNAASKVSLGYAAGDALSFTLTHDTQGKREAINTLKASYTMDAITLTASMADDKNHAGNTNTGSKASQNLTIAYANGPLTASFNNDESSQWWVTSAYDLGNGADIFATVDHTEFAVVGLSFNF